MIGALTLQTAPASEPISIEEAKDHLRVEGVTDDALIQNLIEAARARAEDVLWRSLITAVWNWTLDAFPDAGEVLRVPRAPLQSIGSITYVDTAGVTQTWSASLYSFDAATEPGRIVPAYGQAWPAARDVINAVTVQFTAGYGTSAASVPRPIRQAMLLMIGHWFERREETIVGTIIAEIPLGVVPLLAPHRAMRF